jgi:Transglycosylase SLT domain
MMYIYTRPTRGSYYRRRSAPVELGEAPFSWMQWIHDAVRLGKMTLVTGQALISGISAGMRNVNELTNRVFFARHPERKVGPLKRGEPQFEQLSQEWIQIRDRVVRPVLANFSTPATVPSSTPTAPVQHRGVNKNTIDRINRYNPLIDSIATKYRIDPNIIRGIMAAESGGNPRSGEQNPAGYKGLMQAGKGNEQLDPETSIRSGVEIFIKKRNTVARILKPFGIDLFALDQETILRYVMTAYNAGEGTFKKALEYAHASGDKWIWERPEHFQRALLFTGAYSVRAPLKWCLKKLPPEIAARAIGGLTGVAPAVLLRDYRTQQGWDIDKLRRAFGRVIQGKLYRETLRAKKNSLTLEKARQTLSPLLICSLEFKHAHIPIYINTILRYKRHYDQLRKRP